jgi:hypothetical protein
MDEGITDESELELDMQPSAFQGVLPIGRLYN